MEIYNLPNHPSYGICRRLHLILIYLYGDKLPQLEEKYKLYHTASWTNDVDFSYPGISERVIAHSILGSFTILNLRLNGIK